LKNGKCLPAVWTIVPCYAIVIGALALKAKMGGYENHLKYPVFPAMPYMTALPKLCKNSFPSFMKMA
jgi:hypothetical protein